MPIYRAAPVFESDIVRYAWEYLEQFKNVAETTKRIINSKNIEGSQISNVKKQAEHIRYCIIMAQEYRIAAKSVTISTKPNLLYYSTMWLAIAQFLYRGDGNFNLERAREQNNHHGLVFSCDAKFNTADQFDAQCKKLTARPLGSLNDRKGTFELWHKLAREYPIIGSSRFIHENGGSEVNPADVIAYPHDRRIGHIPEQGISLFDCFQFTPGMYYYLNRSNYTSRLIRVKPEREVKDGKTLNSYTIHADSRDKIDTILSDFKARPRDIYKLSYREIGSGLSVSILNDGDTYIEIPMCSSITTNLSFMYENIFSLNEFGFLYVGAFILGNFSRYYPEIWMKHVESSSYLAHSAKIFLDVVEERAALLTLSELLECYQIIAVK